MFREKTGEAISISPSQMNKTETTVLRQDTKFEGKLIFESGVVINGRLEGEVVSKGELTVGREGHVQGQIEIGTVHIFGEVHGNIKASNKIVINAPAIVKGDIVAPSLVIEEGAVFEGNCSMGNVKNRTKEVTPKSTPAKEEKSAANDTSSEENVLDFKS
jgi:cytoskeletal protein CcmA (bactofilin family)